MNGTALIAHKTIDKTNLQAKFALSVDENGKLEAKKLGSYGENFNFDEADAFELNVEDTPWRPVESSNLAAATWDESFGLAVKFKNGSIYLYPRIGAGLFQDLLKANSKGQFFNQEIKPETAFLKVA